MPTHQVAFIDYDDATLAAKRTSIVNDITTKYGAGGVNLVYRKPGPVLLASTIWQPADCDPLDTIVYAYNADTDVHTRLTKLAVTPTAIDTLP
jgi:hypothetical protein